MREPSEAIIDLERFYGLSKTGNNATQPVEPTNHDRSFHISLRAAQRESSSAAVQLFAQSHEEAERRTRNPRRFAQVDDDSRVVTREEFGKLFLKSLYGVIVKIPLRPCDHDALYVVKLELHRATLFKLAPAQNRNRSPADNSV